MDTLFPPERVFEVSIDIASGAAGHPVALVVPSTYASLRLARDLWRHWHVIGSRIGMKPISSALSALSENAERRPAMVFTDQLVKPADATVLTLLTDMQVYLSPLEYILCSKYGYCLGVWTAGGMEWLEPGADIKDVASLIATHLSDAKQLGTEWLEHDKQRLRLQSHRERNMKRQLRFLHSSTANSYRDDPANPAALQLVERIAALSESIAQGAAA